MFFISDKLERLRVGLSVYQYSLNPKFRLK
jgi:hypothetical protein